MFMKKCPKFQHGVHHTSMRRVGNIAPAVAFEKGNLLVAFGLLGILVK